MDGHGYGHGHGDGRSRWWTVETVWNDLEQSGTKWNETKRSETKRNEVKRSITVTGRFPLKTKDSLYLKN